MNSYLKELYEIFQTATIEEISGGKTFTISELFSGLIIKTEKNLLYVTGNYRIYFSSTKFITLDSPKDVIKFFLDFILTE